MDRTQKILLLIIFSLALALITSALFYPLKWNRKLIKVSGEFAICELSPEGDDKIQLHVYHSSTCDPDKHIGKLK